MSTKLDGELAAVLAAMERIDAVLAAPVFDRDALDAARCALATLLAGHFAFKETLYERMRSVGGHVVEETVRRSRARTLALVVAYRFHLSDWTADAIAADPAGYGADARGLMGRARRLAESDVQTLVPALETLIATSPLLDDLRAEPLLVAVPAV